MSKVQLEEAAAVYGIYHLETGKFVKLGPKVGWNNVSGCKRSMQVHFEGFKFNEQDSFVVVNLTEAFYRLQQMGEQQ